MRYVKALSLCAAVTASLAAASTSTPALGRSAPILVPGPAPEDLVSKHIGYADLNLAAAPGQQMLIRRVNFAVNDMCVQAVGGSDGSVMSRTVQARCARASWEQARPQIDLAFQRARELALTGKSSIAAAALTITVAGEK